MADFQTNRQIAAIQDGNRIVTDKANIVSTNAVTDLDWSEGLGRKADTAVGDPRATASALALIKGLVLAQGGYVAVVDGNKTLGTAFGDADFGAFANDHFNNNFVAMAFSATNITEGTVRLISDFVSSGGVFTTVSMGANYADGDIILIYPRNLICEGSSLAVRLGDIDTVVATGAVTDTDNLYAYTKQAITLLLGTMPGQEFTITKSITASAVTFGAAVDLTAVSTGGVITLKRVAIQNGATGAGGASAGVFIKTNDTAPLNVAILGNGGVLTANLFTGIDIGFQIAVDKKVQIQAGTTDMTGAGAFVVHMTFIRGAEGATIVAA